MKKTITTGAFMFALAATAVIAPRAYADVATTTTIAVTATTTATTTVAATPATTTATATTPVVAPSSKIATLLAQLAKLTELFNNLKAQMMGTKAEIKELRSDIKEGMSDSDVKTIQELLASDKEVYPRGLITGFFGPMTKEAVKRFQAKNGLEVTGEIDAETRAAMDTIIETRKAEGKFPVGLLMAPGIKQKFEDRLKIRCGAATASSTAGMVCDKVKAKYKFGMDDKGKMKMESKVENKKDDDSEDGDEDDN